MNVINDDFMKWLEGVCDKRLQKKLLVAYNEWLLEEEKEKIKVVGVSSELEEKIRMAIKQCLLNEQTITSKVIASMVGCVDKTVQRSGAWKAWRNGTVRVSEEEKKKWKEKKKNSGG